MNISLISLLEIGEATARPYVLRKVNTSGDVEIKGFVTTIYYFDIDDYDRGDPAGRVELDYEQLGEKKGRLDIAFDVETDDQQSRFDSTNLGIKVMNRVMATVIDAVKQFFETDASGSYLTNITFNAEEGKSTGRSGDSRGSKIRKKLYLRYIENLFDVIDIKSFGNQVQVRIKPTKVV